jgi:hypothetical protein
MSQAPRAAHGAAHGAPGRPPEPDRYEIRVQGHLDGRWSDWFDGLTVTREVDGTTVLAGPVVDQAALHGLLQRVRDTGLPLVSVTPAEPDPTTDLDNR